MTRQSLRSIRGRTQHRDRTPVQTTIHTEHTPETLHIRAVHGRAYSHICSNVRKESLTQCAMRMRMGTCAQEFRSTHSRAGFPDSANWRCVAPPRCPAAKSTPIHYSLIMTHIGIALRAFHAPSGAEGPWALCIPVVSIAALSLAPLAREPHPAHRSAVAVIVTASPPSPP